MPYQGLPKEEPSILQKDVMLQDFMKDKQLRSMTVIRVILIRSNPHLVPTTVRILMMIISLIKITRWDKSVLVVKVEVVVVFRGLRDKTCPMTNQMLLMAFLSHTWQRGC